MPLLDLSKCEIDMPQSLKKNTYHSDLYESPSLAKIKQTCMNLSQIIFFYNCSTNYKYFCIYFCLPKSMDTMAKLCPSILPIMSIMYRDLVCAPRFCLVPVYTLATRLCPRVLSSVNEYLGQTVSLYLTFSQYLEQALPQYLFVLYVMQHAEMTLQAVPF